MKIELSDRELELISAALEWIAPTAEVRALIVYIEAKRTHAYDDAS